MAGKDEAYTITCRAQRGCLAKHVDRTFLKGKETDYSFAPHVDRRRCGQNIYYSRSEDGAEIERLTKEDYDDLVEYGGFKKEELDYYGNNYKPGIQARNTRYKKGRKPERVSNVSEYYNGKNTGCEELFIQIGDKDSHLDNETFQACVEDFIERFDAAYGDHCKILDAAIHNDEATPHAHIRRVWETEDKDGLRVNQEKALEAMGIERPDPTMPKNMKNNRKMTFSEMERNLWQEVCIDHGVRVKESERPRTTGKHVRKERYIDEQIRQREMYLDGLNDQISGKEEMLDQFARMETAQKASAIASEAAGELIRDNVELGQGPYKGKVIVEEKTFNTLFSEYKKSKENSVSMQTAIEEAEEERKKAAQMRRKIEFAVQEQLDGIKKSGEEAMKAAMDGTGRLAEKARMYDRIVEDGKLPDPSYEINSPERIFESLEDERAQEGFMDAIRNTEAEEDQEY